MIYGIEQTTDLRSPETRIQKFSSLRSARLWAAKGGDLAWPGAARKDIPGSQQNWHHRLRDLYEMPKGWRPPSEKKLRDEAFSRHTSSYPRGTKEVLASIIRQEGYALSAEDLVDV